MAVLLSKLYPVVSHQTTKWRFGPVKARPKIWSWVSF